MQPKLRLITNQNPEVVRTDRQAWDTAPLATLERLCVGEPLPMGSLRRLASALAWDLFEILPEHRMMVAQAFINEGMQQEALLYFNQEAQSCLARDLVV